MKIVDILVMWMFFPIAGLFMLLNLVFSSTPKTSYENTYDEDFDNAESIAPVANAREYAWRRELTRVEKRAIGVHK